MEQNVKDLANIVKNLTRAEMKKIVGGKRQYTYSDDNPTTHGTPGVGCYVTCDATVSNDGGKTSSSVPGGLTCATYTTC